MDKEKTSLVLVFATPTGKEETITITKPNGALEGTKIKEVMNAVIETGAIGEKVAVASIVGAKYVRQQVDEVNLEEE